MTTLTEIIADKLKLAGFVVTGFVDEPSNWCGEINISDGRAFVEIDPEISAYRIIVCCPHDITISYRQTPWRSVEGGGFMALLNDLKEFK